MCIRDRYLSWSFRSRSCRRNPNKHTNHRAVTKDRLRTFKKYRTYHGNSAAECTGESKAGARGIVWRLSTRLRLRRLCYTTINPCFYWQIATLSPQLFLSTSVEISGAECAPDYFKNTIISTIAPMKKYKMREIGATGLQVSELGLGLSLIHISEPTRPY